MSRINHPFEPSKRDARYCGFVNHARPIEGEFGTISFSSECGFPPSSHSVTHDGFPKMPSEMEPGE